MKLQKPKNWKTTLAGVASVLTGISLVVTGQLIEGLAAIVAGLGLHNAKDAE